MNNVKLFMLLDSIDDKYIADAEIKPKATAISDREHGFWGFFNNAATIVATVVILCAIIVWTLVGKDILNGLQGGSSTDQTTVATTTEDAETTITTDIATKPEPTPDPEPVIDMDELYRKVFENQSVRYTIEEAPNLEDLDKSKDPLLLYFQYFNPQESAQVLDKIWVIEGVSSSFADGLLQKYSITSCNGQGGHRFDFVSGYYHSAYLDVLFENLTFEAVEMIPDDLIRFAMIKGDEKSPDRSYSAYEDMKLYYEEDGVIYCSVQNVDAPYLHMMARAYWAKESNWDVLTAGLSVYNVTLDESKATKKVTVKSSNQEIEYSIYPDGKVYSEVQETSVGQSEKDATMFVYWGETRIYFPTEELFRTVFEGKITEQSK